MRGYLRKLAAMEVPTNQEAKAKEVSPSSAEDNPTGSGSTKCKRCGFVDRDGNSECPNCGSSSMRKTDNGKQVRHNQPEAPDNQRMKNQDRVFSFFRGQAAFKHGPSDDSDSWE